MTINYESTSLDFQEKVYEIVDELLYEDASPSQFQIDGFEVFDWAKQHHHYDLMRACIARAMHRSENVGDKVAERYVVILKNTLFVNKQKELDEMLAAEKDDLWRDNITDILNIKTLREDKPSRRFIFQVLQDIVKIQEGLNPFAALMYIFEDVSRRRFLIDSEFTIDEMQFIINPTLYQAALLGDSELIRSIADSGATLADYERSDLTSKLRDVCSSQNIDIKIVEPLIIAGAEVRDVFIPVIHGYRPIKLLDWLLDKGHKNILGEVLKKRDSVEEIDALNKAIIRFVSSSKSDPEMRKWLLANKKVNFNVLGDIGETFLHLVATNGSPEIAEDILALPNMKQAIINTQNNLGQTALHIAIRAHKVDLARALLTHGIDITVRDLDGSTALHYAVTYRYAEIVECIVLSHNCEPALINAKNRFGKTALEIACNKALLSIKSINVLIKSGADFRGLNIKGADILTWAQNQLSSAVIPEDRREIIISNLRSIVDYISRNTEELSSKGVGDLSV